MDAEQPPPQNESRIASGRAVSCVIWIICIPLFGMLLHVHGVIYLLMVALGLLAGIIYSRWKYPSWAKLMSAPQPAWLGTKRYYIVSVVSIFIAVVILILLEPLPRTVYTSASLGALSGWIAGLFVWPVALYSRRDKTTPAS